MNGNESLMELFRDPNTIHNLSMGEKLLGSTITMILGLGITFMVLILIWIFISLMGKALDVADRKKEAASQTKAAPAQAATEAPAAAAPAEETSDDSLVAVISAAIAAYEGAAADNLIVKKITRLSGESTPWANAANEARMATRKMY